MAVERASHPWLSDERLDALVGPDPHRPGRARTRLIAESIPVWAIIGDLGALAGTTEPDAIPDEIITTVALGFDIPIDAVRAAVRYYALNRCPIDALLEANAAALT